MRKFKAQPAPQQALNFCGVGLRQPHLEQFLSEKPQTGFLEVHIENFFNLKSLNFDYLKQLSAYYPISLHGVGLSLGGSDKLCKDHLKKTKQLIDKINPFIISEHISWSHKDGVHTGDLLPLPLTNEALNNLAEHVNEVQEYFGRQILMENPSSYLAFKNAEMTEPEFIAKLVKKTGCGLLMDVNNIYVSCHNLGWDVDEYLESFPMEAVQEIHIAGYHVNVVNGREIFIDTHGAKVTDEVWQIYNKVTQKIGAMPAIIEWDTNIPELKTLLAEAKKADFIKNSIVGGEDAKSA